MPYTPAPGECTPGLEDKFPDFLPPRAFYLAEVVTPAFTPANLIALKELVETDGGASLKLKRAWVPFDGCSSGVLPLDVFEELSGSGSLLVSPPLKREALDSVDAVHRASSFQPKRSRRIQNQSAARGSQSQLSTTASSNIVSSEASGDSEASYLSLTYVPEEGQYKCRRHFHDGGREDCGRAAIVCPNAAPGQDE